MYDDPDDYDCDPGGNRINDGFANAGSALRAATKSNPRNLPCPNCKRRNVLTPEDRARGYQCDACANRAESGMDS